MGAVALITLKWAAIDTIVITGAIGAAAAVVAAGWGAEEDARRRCAMPS